MPVINQFWMPAEKTTVAIHQSCAWSGLGYAKLAIHFKNNTLKGVTIEHILASP